MRLLLCFLGIVFENRFKISLVGAAVDVEAPSNVETHIDHAARHAIDGLFHAVFHPVVDDELVSKEYIAGNKVFGEKAISELFASAFVFEILLRDIDASVRQIYEIGRTEGFHVGDLSELRVFATELKPLGCAFDKPYSCVFLAIKTAEPHIDSIDHVKRVDAKCIVAVQN